MEGNYLKEELKKISAAGEFELIDPLDLPPLTTDPGAFALQLEDASMAPEFQPGDLIIVSLNTQPESGTMVVARITGRKKAIFRKLLLDGDGVTLKPLNPTYPEIRFNEAERNKIHIIGVVTEMRRFFKSRAQKTNVH